VGSEVKVTARLHDRVSGVQRIRTTASGKVVARREREAQRSAVLPG
jgi:hypothetical protein